jgi:RHS repeat-associated protein
MRASAIVPLLAFAVVAWLAAAPASALQAPAYDPSKVAHPSATVPAGATRYAAVRGELSVSDAGSANYEIPLEVVMGRGGFQPTLSIRYSSSSGGNGQLGVGFALTGLSQISRCPRIVADDGIAQGVQLNANDRFCLNGQKLVLVQGTYGSDGAEYRTLPDSHVRVRSFRPQSTTKAGPAHFVVWTADGQVQEYGGGGNAVIIRDAHYAWPITRALDRSNNVIAYDYAKRMNGVTGEIERWLDAVRYGYGNQFDRRVTFEYEDRPDKSYGWLHGTPRESLRRLKTITMQLNVPPQGWQTARSYKLGYTNIGATGLSKLASVTECGLGTDCKQATTFYWTQGGNSFQAGVAQSAAVPTSASSMLIAADLNGDGRSDLAYPEAGPAGQTQNGAWRYVIATASNANKPYAIARTAGFNPWGTGATAYPFDYDLDGRVDLLPRSPQVSQWRPILTRGDDGSTVRADTDYFSALNQVLEGESALFGDFDGDGYQDVLEQDLIGTVRRWHWRKRSGTVSASIDSAQPFDNLAFSAQQEVTFLALLQPHQVFVLDVNGDGRDEVVFLRLFEEELHALDVVTGEAKRLAGLQSGILNQDIKLLDLNGDGLTDLVTNGSDSVVGKVDALFHRLNTGNGFAPPEAMGVTRDALKASFKAAEVVDTNGDGRDELLIPKYAGIISAGNPQFGSMELVQGKHGTNGALSFTVAASPIGFSLRNVETLAKQGLRILDADGDGADDALIVDRPTLGAGPALKLFSHAAGGKPDLLIRIDQRTKAPGEALNILPITAKISYAPLTDASVYTRGECPRITATTCLAASMHVVKSVHKSAALSDGSNAELVTEYRYRNGRIDKKSRSLLGFAERVAKSYATGSNVPPTTVRSFYSNTESTRDPRLREQWTYSHLPNGRESLERKLLTWAEKPTEAGSYFPYISIIERQRFEFPHLDCSGVNCLDTMTLAQFNALSKKPFERHQDVVSDIDIHGNVLKRIDADFSVNGDAFENIRTTTVTTAFDIDTVQWLVSRPKSIASTDSTQDTSASAPIAKTRVDKYSYPQGDSLHAQRPTQHKQSSAGNTNVLTTDFTYDAAGNLIGRRMTDSVTGAVRESATVYDPLGYPHAASNALGHTSYTGHDPLLGKVKVAVDANGLRTDFVYDALGNLVRATLPDGVVKDSAYDIEHVPAGNEWLLRVRTSDNRSALSETVIDRGGRPVIERFKGFDGALRVKTRAFLPQGWVQSETAYRRADAGGNPERSSYAYDSRGRLVLAVDPNNAVRTWAYDRLQVTYTNARGFKKTWTMDARGQNLRIVDAAGTIEESARRNVYGPFGTLLSSQTEGIDASRSTFEYDERGLLLARDDKERGTATYRYDAFGQPVFMRDAEGRETTWVYDALGRVTQRSVQREGALRSSVDYVYDTLDVRTTRGQLLRIEAIDNLVGNQRHRTDYFYDSLSRLFRQEQRLPSDAGPGLEDAFIAVYDYDALGRLSALRYPKLPGQPVGTQARYEYASTDTSNGRLARVHIDDPLEPDLTVWEALTTDGQDRLARDRSGDGVQTEREFDWRGLPSKVSMQSGSVTLLAELYGYDVEGNLTSREHIDGESDPAERFQYDALDRLTQATHGSFSAPADTWSYDKLGNLSHSLRRGTLTYDAARPTQVVKVSEGLFPARRYTYDAVGNQVGRPEGSMLYNDFDLPARIARSRGDIVATFSYTGNGERARKSTPAGTITYMPGLYERHRTAEGVEHRLRIAAGDRDVATVVYRQRGTNTVVVREPIRYRHAERQGSTSLVTISDPTDGSKVKVIEKRSYDAFGHVRNPDWTEAFLDGIEPAQLEQGYTGHDDDRDFGLVNMKGRLYDSTLGRFITPDPNVDGANASQAWNRYAYVSNNPLRHTDPTGFLTCFGCPEEWGVGGGGSGGGGFNPVQDLMEGWMADDDAFFESGAWGISALNPDSWAGSQLERQARYHDQRVQERIKELNRIDELKQQLAELKKRQEAYALGLKRAKEAAAKLGSTGGRSAATGAGALAESGVCDPGSSSCSTKVAGCDAGATTCSDAVQPTMADANGASVDAATSFPPPPLVGNTGLPSTLDPPPVSNTPPTDFSNPKIPGPPGMPRGMGPGGQVNPVPPGPPTPPPVPLGERILNFLRGLRFSPFLLFDERQWREYQERRGA